MTRIKLVNEKDSETQAPQAFTSRSHTTRTEANIREVHNKLFDYLSSTISLRLLIVPVCEGAALQLSVLFRIQRFL